MTTLDGPFRKAAGAFLGLALAAGAASPSAAERRGPKEPVLPSPFGGAWSGSCVYRGGGDFSREELSIDLSRRRITRRSVRSTREDCGSPWLVVRDRFSYGVERPLPAEPGGPFALELKLFETHATAYDGEAVADLNRHCSGKAFKEGIAVEVDGARCAGGASFPPEGTARTAVVRLQDGALRLEDVDGNGVFRDADRFRRSAPSREDADER